MSTKKVYFSTLLAFFALAALGGCATTGSGAKADDSAVIKVRAEERWNYLIGNKAEKAYDYLSPGYRATKSRDDYAREMNGRAMRWTSARYISQNCDKDSCTVMMSIGYKINMGGPAGNVATTGPVTETWVRSGGKWYVLPDALQPTKLQGHETP